jgi:putative aminopeptidase FrvX
VIWSPDALGADDRAGVFAIIKILQSGLRPHIIFTTDEETGGYGAKALTSNACPFQDVRYFIELDRQGALDCVFYNCDNKHF